MRRIKTVNHQVFIYINKKFSANENNINNNKAQESIRMQLVAPRSNEGSSLRTTNSSNTRPSLPYSYYPPHSQNRGHHHGYQQ
jgi:hypothetical protein